MPTRFIDSELITLDNGGAMQPTSMNSMSKMHHCKSWALLVLRLTVGGIFMYHGYLKFFSPAGIAGFGGMLTNLGVPLAGFMAYVVGLVELLGGLMMILGVFVPIVAALQIAVMLVAIFVAKKAAWPMVELDVALLGILISLVLSGSGKFALMPSMKRGMGCGCCGEKGCACCGKDGKCDPAMMKDGCCGGHEHGEMKK